jgi:hypothetical protein
MGRIQVTLYSMFAPNRLFQPIIMFVGEAKSLHKSGAPERCFTRLGFGLIQKHLTRLERPARSKHSSLLGPFVSYKENKVF